MVRISLCGECYLQEYCRRLESRVVTDAELTPEFIRSVRAHMRVLNISPSEWGWFLIDAYRDYPGLITDPKSGCIVELDMTGFENRNFRYWFRDLLEPLPSDVIPRIREQARNRFKVMASILRAIDPVKALLWGKTVANDVDTAAAHPVVKSGEAACPYRHFRYFDAAKLWGEGE